MSELGRWKDCGASFALKLDHNLEGYTVVGDLPIVYGIGGVARRFTDGNYLTTRNTKFNAPYAFSLLIRFKLNGPCSAAHHTLVTINDGNIKLMIDTATRTIGSITGATGGATESGAVLEVGRWYTVCLAQGGNDTFKHYYVNGAHVVSLPSSDIAGGVISNISIGGSSSGEKSNVDIQEVILLQDVVINQLDAERYADGTYFSFYNNIMAPAPNKKNQILLTRTQMRDFWNNYIRLPVRTSLFTYLEKHKHIGNVMYIPGSTGATNFSLSPYTVKWITPTSVIPDSDNNKSGITSAMFVVSDDVNFEEYVDPIIFTAGTGYNGHLYDIPVWISGISMSGKNLSASNLNQLPANMKVVSLNNTNVKGDISVFAGNVKLIELRLGGCSDVTGSISALEATTELTTLELHECTQIGGDLSSLTDKPYLSRLVLTNCHAVTGDFTALDVGYLAQSNLHLEGTAVYGDMEDLPDNMSGGLLLLDCPGIYGNIVKLNTAQLNYLNLRGCSQITGNVAHLWNCTNIDIGGTDISGNLADLSVVVQFCESFNIPNCAYLTGTLTDVATILASSATYGGLDLSNCPLITGDIAVFSGIETYGAVILDNMPQLTGSISSIGSSWYSLASFKNCTGLTGNINSLYYIGPHLDLSGCTGITGSIDDATMSACNGVLKLSGCTGITGSISSAGAGTFFGGCTSLDLSNCSALTGNVEALQAFTYLNLSGCSLLTGDLSNSNVPGMNGVLNLSGCVAITGNISYFLSSTGITDINISNCPLITGDVDVCNGSVFGTVDFTNCNLLTGSLSNFTNVNTLKVAGCSLLTGSFTVEGCIPPRYVDIRTTGVSAADIVDILTQMHAAGGIFTLIANVGVPAITDTTQNRALYTELITRGGTISVNFA